MSFLDNLKEEASFTETLNGAKTHASSGDACLDLFAVAGGMRHRSYRDQIHLFDRAYIENPELAMKLLFYIRDIREGLGERELFRNLIRHTAKTWPESARKNIALISEYGRFDDLMCLMGTPSEKAVVELIRTQLNQDCEALKERKAGNINAHISLLAKWLPSINTSSARKRGQAKVLASALGMGAGQYRKLLSTLRANIALTERYLTSQKPDKINYEAVPAGAMLKYHKSFHQQDAERFSKFLSDVDNGQKSIHCGTLYPYEILRPLMSHGRILPHCEPDAANAALETLWNQQTSKVCEQNAISVIDVSGSMYCHRYGTPSPALIAQALGLYHAEHCTGTFHNTFITFSSTPELVEIHGRTLEEKLRYIQSSKWEFSTNLEAVFDLILRTAVNAGTPQEEMPSTLFIISDMEFDSAMKNPDKTIYDNAKAAFEAKGYHLPAVVFHNVNSWQMQTPVRSHTRGTALASGAGTNSFNYKFDGNITPMDHMLRVLTSPRYAAVHA